MKKIELKKINIKIITNYKINIMVQQNNFLNMKKNDFFNQMFTKLKTSNEVEILTDLPNSSLKGGGTCNCKRCFGCGTTTNNDTILTLDIPTYKL